MYDVSMIKCYANEMVSVQYEPRHVCMKDFEMAYAKLVDMIDVYDYACTINMKRVRKGNEMVDDRVLDGFIHNMGKPMIPEIHGHLQNIGFLQVSQMSKAIALQIGLPVDGPVITGSGIIPDKVTLYRSLLGKVPDKFEGCRISMNSLKDNFDEFPKEPTEQIGEVIQQYT
ncbi:hypothetical protein PVK06_020488 [Gossypium arboreum]|uniref:Uncharacterized protein n=1 Tax=Gossypium arboreum TaxID=29729 RepID=A0ABR0PMI0_GOSAR|nr:hypothetical protein PVK06_020488 [Gossypium arboreum]